MDLNEKMAKEIAQQLGLGGGAGVSQDTLKKLEHKSDAELVREISKLQAQLAANNITPQQQRAMVQSLMPMMKGEQRARLERIMQMLGAK